MANRTFRPMAQNPLQIVAQPQSNDALMASILAQQVGSNPRNLGDAFLNLANLYTAGKYNTRANAAEADRIAQVNEMASRELLGGQSVDPTAASQAGVIAGSAPAPMMQPESASVVPVERSPLPPPVSNPQNSMAGQMPPDGGPPFGALTVEQPGPNDVVPTEPYQMADAGTAGPTMPQQPDFSQFDSQIDQLQTQRQELLRAKAIFAGNNMPAPHIDVQLANLDATLKGVEGKRADAYTQWKDSVSRFDADREFGLKQSTEQRQIDKAQQETEAAQKAEEARVSEQKAFAKQAAKEVERAIKIIDEGGGEGWFDLPAAGPGMGTVASMDAFGLTDAGELSTLLGEQGVGGKTGLNALIKAKESSKTGASGFGALNEKELDLLMSSFGNLSQNQRKEFLRDNLQEILNGFKKAAGEEVSTPSQSAGQQRLRFNPETGDFE